MKAAPSHATTILFVLLGLIASCRTGTVPPAPSSSEPSPQADTLQTPHSSPDEPVPEATIATPEPAKIPAPAPVQRVWPESILSEPQKESVAPAIKYDTVLTKRSVLIAAHSGWQYRNNRQSQIVGFEFSNHGGNRILPPRYDISKDQLYTRDFQFRFDDRARQDVHLSITDWAASRNKQFRLSELMNSVMLFFPRNYLPALVNVGERNILTLPTGEEVEFNAATHEVTGGVFLEEAVDLNPDKSVRKFPSIRYTGKGVMVRADARGSDPRLGTLATITTGSPAPDCFNGKGCHQCEVPAKELWSQSGAARFKFAQDQDFHKFLVSRCEFGLPMNKTDFVSETR